jgi:hypothetical protein
MSGQSYSKLPLNCINSFSPSLFFLCVLRVFAVRYIYIGTFFLNRRGRRGRREECEKDRKISGLDLLQVINYKLFLFPSLFFLRVLRVFAVRYIYIGIVFTNRRGRRGHREECEKHRKISGLDLLQVINYKLFLFPSLFFLCFLRVFAVRYIYIGTFFTNRRGRRGHREECEKHRKISGLDLLQVINYKLFLFPSLIFLCVLRVFAVRCFLEKRKARSHLTIKPTIKSNAIDRTF